MKTNAVCPISYNRTDNNLVRLNAAFTVLLLLAFFLTSKFVFILVLFADFMLRASGFAQYSLFAFLSKRIVRILNLKQKPVNAGPKIFAARIGVIFNISILLFLLLGLPSIAFSIASVFAFFAFLEAAFGFCLACKVYPFFYSFTAGFKNAVQP